MVPFHCFFAKLSEAELSHLKKMITKAKWAREPAVADFLRFTDAQPDGLPRQLASFGGLGQGHQTCPPRLVPCTPASLIFYGPLGVARLGTQTCPTRLVPGPPASLLFLAKLHVGAEFQQGGPGGWSLFVVVSQSKYSITREGLMHDCR